MPEVLISGPDGRLEAKYNHVKSNAPIALVLHHHPAQDGNMNSKPVYALYHTFVSKGYNTLRFNFRGIGKSEGKFEGGENELSDAAAVLDWLQFHNPNAPACWVSGFSFGSWIAMQLLMRRPEIDGFISASPPANNLDFSFLAPCPVSGLFVYGANDVVTPPSSVNNLACTLSAQRNISITEKEISGADHYFDNCLDQFMAVTGEYIKTTQEKLKKTA